jgi:DNA-binding FrmR family transcriptional regulator
MRVRIVGAGGRLNKFINPHFLCQAVERFALYNLGARSRKEALVALLKMVEEDRYCMDISTQLMATEAMLNKINKEILTAHLKHCVSNAETQEERDQKVDELVHMLGKLMK